MKPSFTFPSSASIWFSVIQAPKAINRTLDRLGGLGWHKTKAKAKRAMRDMADELLRLYAERKLVQGHAFPTDAPVAARVRGRLRIHADARIRKQPSKM